MPIEYNKSHMQDILKKNAKIAILHNCIVSLEKSFQKRVHSVSLRFPNTFICFLVFGNRDETLVLVFEMVLAKLKSLFLQGLMENFGVKTQLDAFKLQCVVRLMRVILCV